MVLLEAFSAYDLPIVKALVRYLHASTGFSVRSTWIAVIKAGDYYSWPGLTYANAFKISPDSDEKLKIHLKQTCQGLHSNSRKAPPRPTTAAAPPIRPVLTILPPVMSKELHIHVEHVSKLYTNNTGRFPI